MNKDMRKSEEIRKNEEIQENEEKGILLDDDELESVTGGIRPAVASKRKFDDPQ